MFSSFDAEFARNLDRIEHHLIRPGRTRFAGQELRNFLRYFHHEVVSDLGKSPLGQGMHDRFHELMHRSQSIRSPQEVKDLIRDIRTFQISLSSLAHSTGVEARLSSLEQRTKAVPDDSAADRVAEPESVTLESLAKKRFLFAMMPFNDSFEDVWTGGIKRASSGTGLTPIRIDMLTQSSEITDDIVQAIRMSEVIVVDLTGNNPNVMFEFGFALAKGKKPVVISQSTEYLTFDIKNLRTLIYKNTWQGIESLHKDLQPFIRSALGKKARRRNSKKKPESAAS